MCRTVSPTGYLIFGLVLIAGNMCTMTNATILAGVTIKSHPFVYVSNNRFSGFCVDLMEYIKLRTQLNYSLYLVEDNSYGPGMIVDGKLNGMIGDVYNKKADFAIADLTVTDDRSRYVNFTRPFFTFSVSALVRRELAKNLNTIDDLAIKSNLTVGSFVGGKTLAHMQQLRKNIRSIRWLYNRIVKDSNNMVRTEQEALHKVKHEDFAFVQEEAKNLFIAYNHCDLKVLLDPNYYISSQYAIAFHPDSPYLPVFDRAIQKLEDEGVLDRLRRKYFVNTCSSGANKLLSSSNFMSTMLFLFSTVWTPKIMFTL